MNHEEQEIVPFTLSASFPCDFLTCRGHLNLIIESFLASSSLAPQHLKRLNWTEETYDVCPPPTQLHEHNHWNQFSRGAP